MAKSKTLELVYVDPDLKEFIGNMSSYKKISRSAYVREVLRKERERVIEQRYKI